MTVRITVPHDEIVRAIIEHVTNSNTFGQGLPDNVTVQIVDDGGGSVRAVILFEEALS